MFSTVAIHCDSSRVTGSTHVLRGDYDDRWARYAEAIQTRRRVRRRGCTTIATATVAAVVSLNRRRCRGHCWSKGMEMLKRSQSQRTFGVTGRTERRCARRKENRSTSRVTVPLLLLLLLALLLLLPLVPDRLFRAELAKLLRNDPARDVEEEDDEELDPGPCCP